MFAAMCLCLVFAGSLLCYEHNHIALLQPNEHGHTDLPMTNLAQAAGHTSITGERNDLWLSLLCYKYHVRAYTHIIIAQCSIKKFP